MKLLQKTNRYYITFSVIILLIAGGILYFVLLNFFREDVDEKQQAILQQIILQLHNDESLPDFSPYIVVNKMQSLPETKTIWKDTLIYNTIEQEAEPFRELTSFQSLNGNYYRIIVRTSLIESHDYMMAIGLAIGMIFLLIFAGMLLGNIIISKRLWSGFYANLSSLKSFSIEEKRPLLLQDTNINEFRELNETMEKLTRQARQDYTTLKEFTENASHELQTPLAIIQSKTEMLIQQPGLSEEQASLISSIYDATRRLKTLNQNLLLLTKIENHQTGEIRDINLSQLIEKRLVAFQEIVQTRGITLQKEITVNITIKGNEVLCETLLNNLLSNAIVHNVPDGMVDIRLEAGMLTISNSGKKLSIDPEKLFDRFQKSDSSSGSAGLGLAIAKKICDISGWEIHYQNIEIMHIVSIVF